MLNDIVQLMNESSRTAVSLLPIFRSQAQYRLVGELYSHPGQEFTIGELAGRTGASHPTASRETDRLEEAGLARSRSEGRRRLVSAATDTPVFRPLRDLMSFVYGPPAILREEFADVDGELVLFGSWAARWLGEPGPVPRDIDVLLIGDADPQAAWAAAAAASERIGVDVNVVLRTEQGWRDEDTGFARQVKQGPQVRLDRRAAS